VVYLRQEANLEEKNNILSIYYHYICKNLIYIHGFSDYFDIQNVQKQLQQTTNQPLLKTPIL